MIASTRIKDEFWMEKNTKVSQSGDSREETRSWFELGEETLHLLAKHQLHHQGEGAAQHLEGEGEENIWFCQQGFPTWLDCQQVGIQVKMAPQRREGKLRWASRPPWSPCAPPWGENESTKTVSHNNNNNNNSSKSNNTQNFSFLDED